MDGGPPAAGRFAVTGGRVAGPSGVADGLAVVCRDAVIEAVLPAASLDPALPRVEVGGRLVTPGLIDLHVHGAFGHSFNQPDPRGYDQVLGFVAGCGVTAVQASLVSAPIGDLVSCLDLIAGHRPAGPQARLLGAHLEGPFLNPAQRGAHDPAFLRQPDPDTVDRLLAHAEALTMVTLAPELPGAVELVGRLATAGVVPAAGHSCAGAEPLRAAVAAGLCHLTHLWSGQSVLARDGPGRRPGLLEESLASDGLTAEVIADGRHLPPALLTIARRCLPGRLCVVSDATAGTGLPEGARFQLGSVPCQVRDRVGMVVEPGTPSFGGSVTPLNRMLAHLHRELGWPLAEVLAMATEVPAAVLGRSGRLGRIAAGYDADLAVFEDDFTAWATLVGGGWAVTPPGRRAGTGPSTPASRRPRGR